MNNKPRRLYLFSFILMAASTCGGGLAAEGQTQAAPAPSQPQEVVQEGAGDAVSQDARRRWQQLAPEQKQKLRKRLEQWKNLDPSRKEEIKQRFQRYQQMPPEMKKKVRRNWDRIRTLPPQRRQEIGEKYQKWQHLPPEKKQLIRERYKRFEGAPPEQRQRLRERREQWRNLPPQRKQELRDEFKKRRQDRRGGYLPQDLPGAQRRVKWKDEYHQGTQSWGPPPAAGGGEIFDARQKSGGPGPQPMDSKRQGR